MCIIQSHCSCALWRLRATATQWKTWSTSGKKAVLWRWDMYFFSSPVFLRSHSFGISCTGSLVNEKQADWQCSQFQGDSYASPTKPTLEVALARIAFSSVLVLVPWTFYCAISALQIQCFLKRFSVHFSFFHGIHLYKFCAFKGIIVSVLSTFSVLFFAPLWLPLQMPSWRPMQKSMLSAVVHILT